MIEGEYLVEILFVVTDSLFRELYDTPRGARLKPMLEAKSVAIGKEEKAYDGLV